MSSMFFRRDPKTIVWGFPKNPYQILNPNMQPAQEHKVGANPHHPPDPYQAPCPQHESMWSGMGWPSHNPLFTDMWYSLLTWKTNKNKYNKI